LLRSEDTDALPSLAGLFLFISGFGGASADALITPTSQTLQRSTKQLPGAFTPAAPVRFHLVLIDDQVVQGT
jgi:hypothetical protein